MFRFKTLLLAIALTAGMSSFVPAQTIPSPQSLMVTLTGYRNAENQLKCKLYYMVTLPEDASFIKKVHVTLQKPIGELDNEVVSDLIIPNDWDAAKSVDGVVSYYTTRNILYIGIGEYDLLRKYECKISFIDENGNESKAAVFRK